VAVGSALVRLPLPSTGFVLAAAFFAIVVLVRTVQPLLDGDVWWHIRAGETVFRTGSVPTTDSWTIVGSGMRWISQDWLSNVGIAALYAVDRHGTFLSLAFGILVVAAFVLIDLYGLCSTYGPVVLA
jgi:hypothetical protein